MAENKQALCTPMLIFSFLELPLIVPVPFAILTIQSWSRYVQTADNENADDVHFNEMKRYFKSGLVASFVAMLVLAWNLHALF